MNISIRKKYWVLILFLLGFYLVYDLSGKLKALYIGLTSMMGHSLMSKGVTLPHMLNFNKTLPGIHILEVKNLIHSLPSRFPNQEIEKYSLFTTNSKPPQRSIASQNSSRSNVYKGLMNQLVKMIEMKLNREVKELQRNNKNFEIAKNNSLEPSKILILASWRTGSSFLGQLLQSYPSTFYSFEPTHLFSKTSDFDKKDLFHLRIQLLKDIFSCNFTSHKDYIDHSIKEMWLQSNERLWKGCAPNPAYCSDPIFFSRVCQLMTINLIKTVDFKMSNAVSLMDDIPTLKIIFLVRDPRGLFDSRIKVDWCSKSGCREPSLFCEDLMDDFSYFKKISIQYPERIMMVRFEDLCLSTKEVTRNIFSFLKLPYSMKISKFLEKHTNSLSKNEAMNPHSTFRMSKKVVYKWRKNLNFTQVQNVQKFCSGFMRNLGYRELTTQLEFRNFGLSPLIDL